MSIFRRLRDLRAADHAAIENSNALSQEMDRTGPDVEQMHRTAQQKLREAEEQARRLQAADHRNHYSESLTHAFRGRPA